MQKRLSQHKIETAFAMSGKRDSNSRPQPWQGCALPTELFPQMLLSSIKELCPEQDSNLHASRHTHLKRARLPIPPPGHLFLSDNLHPMSGKRDSNSRPQPWQGCALPTELFPQMNVKRRRLELPRHNVTTPSK